MAVSALSALMKTVCRIASGIMLRTYCSKSALQQVYGSRVLSAPPQQNKAHAALFWIEDVVNRHDVQTIPAALEGCSGQPCGSTPQRLANCCKKL